MAEAIGIVASVVQLAGTGLKLSQALYQYADSVANADRRIKEVAKEIQLTSCVIEELGNVFKQDDTLNLISKSAIATANETLKECSTLFGEIETTLSKSRKGKMGRLMLPFRENKMELLRSHIDKLKSTLQLLMQVLLHAHQVASKKIDREAEARQRDEIRQLLEEKKNTTKRYEESLRTYAASDSSTEVEDDAFSLYDKESASMVEIKSIGSTVNPDSIAECIEHVRSLLESMERLQKALTDKHEGDDHANHHQTAVGSYFMARRHLDSILLGSSNRTNLKDTEAAMRQPASIKTVIPTADKPCAVEKEKEEASLVMETGTTTDKTKTRLVTMHSQVRGSSQRTVPEQVSTEAKVRPRPPPVIEVSVRGSNRTDGKSSKFVKPNRASYSSEVSRGFQTREEMYSLVSESALDDSNINPASPELSLPSARRPTVGPSTYGPSTIDFDMMSRRCESEPLRPRNILSVSPTEPPAKDGDLIWIVGGSPADFRARDTMHKVRNAAMVSHLNSDKDKKEIVVPESTNVSQVRHSHQSSKFNIHGSGPQTSGERRRDTLVFGGKENDLSESAPEGNDEVDKLLREWTTCFS